MQVMSTHTTTPRYTFERSVTDYGDGTYGVSAVTDRGWSLTWFVEAADGGWVITRSTPSNESKTIKTTGSLGKSILARVQAHLSRKENSK